MEREHDRSGGVPGGSPWEKDWVDFERKHLGRVASFEEQNEVKLLSLPYKVLSYLGLNQCVARENITDEQRTRFKTLRDKAYKELDEEEKGSLFDYIFWVDLHK